MDRTIGLRFVLAASLLLAVGACKEEDPEEGEVITRQTIGPEGGTISGNGLTLVFPAGALNAETEIELRTSDTKLGARDFEQTGDTVSIQPQSLELRLPATLTFDALPAEGPAILFHQDELTVAALGSTAYLNELSVVAPAKAGEAVTSVLEPMLASTPEGAGAAVRDTLPMSIQTTETPRLQLVLTAYDTAQAYQRPLNGNGAGDCGFKIENVVGGSQSAGCTESAITAEIRVTSDTVTFDVLPFLAGKLDTPVTVGVVAGSEELAYQLGFFSFDTGACFQETCSGHGTCELQGDQGQCVCDDGYAPGAEPFTCDCVPQCDGRSCGPDACGGNCGPGCGDTEDCMDGTCVPGSDDSGSTSGDSGMGSTGMGDTGMGSTSDGTTGGGTTGGTTTGTGSTSA